MTRDCRQPDLRLHHVGVVVRKLEDGRRSYERLGFSDRSPVYRDSVQRVAVQFIRLGTDVQIELIEPQADDSPVMRFLDKHGPGLHHLCYEVEDIEAACTHFREQGAIITCAPIPAVAFERRRIAFLYERGNLFELLESLTVEPT